MEPSNSLSFDPIKFDDAMKTFKKKLIIDKSNRRVQDFGWILLKLNKQHLEEKDIDWLVEEIAYLDFFMEMLEENDEVELESATTEYVDISEEDKVFIYTSLKSVKKGTET